MLNQIIIRNFLPISICNNLIYWYDSEGNNSKFYKSELLPFPEEKNNMTNTIYTSRRSKGLEYNFVENPLVRIDVEAIQKKLFTLTNVEFNGEISNHCLPIFRYLDKGLIKAHRDVVKTSEKIEYQDLIAVIMLSQRNEDFNHGRFYLNNKAKCSEDGKKVTKDYVKDRYYPLLNKGDLFIFNNKEFIHGVESTEVEVGKKGRFTCSFRTK